jgi:hypothetical protein
MKALHKHFPPIILANFLCRPMLPRSRGPTDRSRLKELGEWSRLSSNLETDVPIQRIDYFADRPLDFAGLPLSAPSLTKSQASGQ